MNASTANRPARSAAAIIRVDVLDGQGERLLAQDVLAGLERPDRPVGVEVVRQGDVDDVDVGSVEQRLVRAVRRAGSRGSGRSRPPARRSRLATADELAARRWRRAPRTIRGAMRPVRGCPSGAWSWPGIASVQGRSSIRPATARRARGLTPSGSCKSLSQTFEREEHKPCVVLELGQRSETVRRANLSAIVRELHERGPQSRSELVARTGLTRSAIRGLIGELVAAGLVSEERAAPLGTPGRPSPVVRPNPERRRRPRPRDRGRLAGGGRSSASAATSSSCIRVDRPPGHTSIDQVATDLGELAALVRARATRASIAARGRRRDRRRRPPGRRLRRDRPEPRLDATSRSASVSPRCFGQRRSRSPSPTTPTSAPSPRSGAGSPGAPTNVLFISGEVGVGGGLVVDGKPMTGVAGYAGEVGHIPVNPAGVPCRCGSIGCWETEIGERTPCLRQAGHPDGGGRAEVDAVLRDAAAGDPTALAALDRVGRWLGFGLAGLVNVFNPRLVVLGGLFGRIHPFVGDVVDARARPAHACRPRARSSGSSRRRSARTPRCSAPPSSPSSRSWPIRPPGSDRATACPRWPAPHDTRPSAQRRPSADCRAEAPVARMRHAASLRADPRRPRNALRRVVA